MDIMDHQSFIYHTVNPAHKSQLQDTRSFCSPDILLAWPQGGGGLNHTQMCVSKMDGKEYFFRLQVAKMNEMLSFKENGGGGLF